jgi:two-component system nitrogen regulation sensor histidine kinase NtrY
MEEHGGGIELLDRPDGAPGAMVKLWFPVAGLPAGQGADEPEPRERRAAGNTA